MRTFWALKTQQHMTSLVMIQRRRRLLQNYTLKY